MIAIKRQHDGLPDHDPGDDGVLHFFKACPLPDIDGSGGFLKGGRSGNSCPAVQSGKGEDLYVPGKAIRMTALLPLCFCVLGGGCAGSAFRPCDRGDASGRAIKVEPVAPGSKKKRPKCPVGRGAE